MSVKETYYLTREQAELKYRDLGVSLGMTSRLSDGELENKLEEINDRTGGGEGFENYIIN